MMPPWVVVELRPGSREPVFESAEFKDHDSAIMYADVVARALATLYGNPMADPVLIHEDEDSWLINMDYPHHADHNYTTLKVVERNAD